MQNLRQRLRSLRLDTIPGAATASMAMAMVPLQTRERSVVEIALIVSFLILCLGIHEAAHAWVAHLRGDDTAKEMGRMSLNPVVHIDPMMTVIVPAFLAMSGAPIFGGARPVPVNPNRLRNRHFDMALVAIAGPASNFLLAILFAVIWKLLIANGIYERNQLVPVVLESTVFFNLILTVFNLLPIPPLDGSRVLKWLLPPGLREPYAGLERFGLLLVIGFIFFVPGVRELIGNTTWTFYEFVDRITPISG